MAEDRSWTKYELPSAAVKKLPPLAAAFTREGAWRVCVLASPQPVTQPAPEPGAGYAVIKVPALEGTELWITPSSDQSAVEAALGFGKPSTPVLNLTGADLAGALAGVSLEDTGETLG